jgi:hypothetical protein
MDVWLGIWMDILVDIWECVSPPAPAAASAAARLPAAGATGHMGGYVGGYIYLYGYMGGYIDGYMGGYIKWIYRRLHRWIYGWVYGWIYWWIYGSVCRPRPPQQPPQPLVCPLPGRQRSTRVCGVCVRGQHSAPHRQTTPPSVCLGGDRRVCVSAVWSVSRRRAAVRPVSAVLSLTLGCRFLSCRFLCFRSGPYKPSKLSAQIDSADHSFKFSKLASSTKAFSRLHILAGGGVAGGGVADGGVAARYVSPSLLHGLPCTVTRCLVLSITRPSRPLHHPHLAAASVWLVPVVCVRARAHLACSELQSK